ncbi:MAG TPA: glycosyltransferase family 39 protein, partial [Solirubrobacteraceae bacterium]|nr:glycosyltransferase family 39 protein [Solirubrobacteraceae bacterium]
MSVPERANSRARPGLPARPGQRETGGGRQATVDVRASIASQIGVARWSADAWSAIAATVAFIAITCWWLTQDRSIPIYDAGDQLETAFEYHAMLQSGNLFGPLTHESVYPIFAQIVGSLGAFIGGVNVASPIVAENLVFVPLLALGCYQTGRLLFGPLAGALAVVFVLGSSLLISLFHMFLLDAPLAAMVSVSIWLVLASEDFSRPGVSALAGLAVGLGMNVKVQFATFLIGLIVIVLARGGWRNRRGLVAFAAVALVVGIPWYAAHVSELGKMFELASSGPGTPPGNIPPTFSTANLTWYFWSVLNGQLLLPLFLLAFIGTLYTIATLSRDRAKRGVRLELLWGGFLAWV